MLKLQANEENGPVKHTVSCKLAHAGQVLRTGAVCMQEGWWCAAHAETSFATMIKPATTLVMVCEQREYVSRVAGAAVTFYSKVTAEPGAGIGSNKEGREANDGRYVARLVAKEVLHLRGLTSSNLCPPSAFSEMCQGRQECALWSILGIKATIAGSAGFYKPERACRKSTGDLYTVCLGDNHGAAKVASGALPAYSMVAPSISVRYLVVFCFRPT
jgi:hypothetical protein